MNWLRRKRIKQVLQYGWKDSKEISAQTGENCFSIWLDIVRCFHNYYLFSNQYKAKEMWKLNEEERRQLAKTLGKANRYRDDWTIWRYENMAFIQKYSSYKYGSSPARYKKRLTEYMKRYNLGDGAKVSNNVIIERNHYLEGCIRVGRNVLLSKNVYIDYSGELVIHDNVSIANGVIIETHTHPLEKSRQVPVPSRLEIGEGVKVLSQSYIADTCHSIGRYARIGAGTYVRSNIPPYAIVMGNPAKIIGFLYSPEEMEDFERDKYPESERTSLDQYTQWYEKYFRSRSKEIKSFIKL